MEIIIAKDYDSVCELAAEILTGVVAANPDATLGLATGSTPLGVYARLVSAVSDGALSLEGCKSFNLDEYVGAGANKAQAVRGMVKGEVDERMPASVLQRHADVTVILDEAAAELL